jgi:hypothetical protein
MHGCLRVSSGGDVAAEIERHDVLVLEEIQDLRADFQMK